MAATTADSEKIWFKFYPSNRDWETAPVMSDVKDIKDLKQAIKKYDDDKEVGKKKMLYGVDLDEVTLNASLQDDYSESISVPGPLNLETVLKRLGVTIIGNDICKQFAEKVWIFVNLPQQAPKRRRDDDEEQPSKKARTISGAILMAGLRKENQGDKYESELSQLNSEERVKVLSHYDMVKVMAGTFYSISKTARAFRESGTVMQDILTSSGNSKFPVVGTKDLYIREEYRELYDRIKSQFTLPTESLRDNRLILTGTPGIGKSAFLVYFAIRLLVESDENDPPIIVFQEKDSLTCYVYGGTSILLRGNISDFRDLLIEQETWYLVDSSKDPVLDQARAVFSASPKTLNGRLDGVAKEVSNYYHMSPWTLDELTTCRSKVKFFNKVDYNFMEKLFFKMGGVPRYVLQTPADILKIDMNAVEAAEKAACLRVNEAIDTVKDAANLLQCFAQGMDSKKFSGRILHRRPTTDHNDFYLDWASPYVEMRIVEKLKDQAWKEVLTQLVKDGKEIDKGPLFELYALHLFRKGGFKFDIKGLTSNSDTKIETLDIPVKPGVKSFKASNELSALSTQPGTLFIPTIPNFPCIDSALGPDVLFQVTVSSNHPIKQAPLKEMLDKILGDNQEKKIRLIFVVPDFIYTDFKAQNYHTEKDVLSLAVPKIIQDHVDQYAIRINLDAAYRGGSPGSSSGVHGSSGLPGSSSGVHGSSGSPGSSSGVHGSSGSPGSSSGVHGSSGSPGSNRMNDSGGGV